MATIMSAFLQDITGVLKDIVEDKMNKTLGAADEMSKLQKKLENAANLAGGAEKKEIQDADSKFWIDKLRQLAYDVEDAIDCYFSEAGARNELEQRAKKSILHRIGMIFTVNRSEYQLVKHSIKSLGQKMDDILKTSSQLQITPAAPRNENATSNHNTQLVCHDGIVGENLEETASLIEKLTEEDKATSVVAIVGLGGLGKTTLARKMYDDQRTVSAFGIRLWVCVSKDFTDTGLLSSVIGAAGGNPRGVQTRAQLERTLARLIKGKRFLLVLDDVWSGQIYEDILQVPLHGGAQGSRVLVTARSESVATQMKACCIHKVSALTEQDGLSLLYRKASLDEPVDPGLSDIAKEIVQSCSRLPMAIRIIGGVLRTKQASPDEWQKVHKSDGWSFKEIPEGSEGVMRTICLSYVHLPSHLKQCFLYCCSLFPAGSAIGQRFITQLWISEGLVERKEDTTPPEKVADCYYRELVSRNLLQPQPGRHDIEECTVHYIVQSFVQFLTRHEILAGDLKHMELFSAGVRRLSAANRGLTAIPEEIERLTSLRTLFLFGNPLGDPGLDEMFRRLKYLRVLDLGATAIEHIPDTLGNLLHLRHLNLSQTKIKKLPDSITLLRNLSHLDLEFCDRLHSLPEGIQNLWNLRYLNLRHTTALEKVPQKLSNLERLSLLHGFVANNRTACQKDQNGWRLEELKPMKNLRSLQILKIERVLDHSEASEVLNNKPHLKNLELCCSTDNRQHLEVPNNEAERTKHVFDALCPPEYVESLEIVSYYGKQYPNWMSESHLGNLQRLVIVDCKFCENLPNLGQLPNLRFLSVISCWKLQCIEQAGISSQAATAFPKLEELHFKDMRKLDSLSGFEASKLPSLRKLRLENCPKLKCLPANVEHATALTSMEIRHADSLEVVDNIRKLKELVVETVPKLAKISRLPVLEVLTIISCVGLTYVEEVRSLSHLHIEGEQLTELPQWLRQHSPRLQTLKLVGKAELFDRCRNAKNWQVIRNIARVYANSPDGSPYFSYSRSTGGLWLPQREDPSAVAATVAGATGVTSSSSNSFNTPILPQNNHASPTAQADRANVHLNWMSRFKETTKHSRVKALILVCTSFLLFLFSKLNSRLSEPLAKQEFVAALVIFTVFSTIVDAVPGARNASSSYSGSLRASTSSDLAATRIDGTQVHMNWMTRLKETIEDLNVDVLNMIIFSFGCALTLPSLQNTLNKKLLALLTIMVFAQFIFVVVVAVLKILKGRLRRI